jgi:hypothetical protein
MHHILRREGKSTMIDVKEEQDGSFTISWDENDPTESILNTWTEQDFIDCIKQECEKIIDQNKP